MDIVLATINAKWIHPSLALRLLKANLGSLQDRCEILEFALRQPLKEKVEPILKARPRLLGLSVSIWNHRETIELLEVLAEKWEEKPVIVLGGPEVSWLPEDEGIFCYADHVIRGEGESAFRALCYRLFNEECRDDEAAAPIKSAYHHYTDEDLKKKLLYVEASRGCPFGCEFCQAGLQEIRLFPLEPFFEEMGKLIDRGARVFKFLDRSFNLHTDRAFRIMEFFLERIEALTGETGENPPFGVHFELVPSCLPPALKTLLRRFPPGTLRLEIGFQTFNPETAALIKRIVPDEWLESLDFLRRETNALIHADLIAGLPGENLSSFGAGFDKLWLALSSERLRLSDNMRKFEIQLGILKCLPGTAIVRHTETHKMRYSPEPPYEVLETGAMTAAELDRVKNFARFWEIIVNRNPFPDLLPSLLPPEKPAFDSFMSLSDRLFEHFGRNWGIEREKLRVWLEKFA